MAIKINLYHEIQRARIEEQYDPLKISFVFLGLVGACLVGWYFMRLNETNRMRGEYSTQQDEMARLTPLAKSAKENEQKYIDVTNLANNFSKRIEERFYWAPVLDRVSAIIPKNVQIIKMTADSNPNEYPRRVSLSIEGLAAGAQPRKVAEDLRLGLSEALGGNYTNFTASFKSLDDSIERVLIDGQEASTAIFSIAINFTIEATTSSAGAAPTSVPGNTAQR